MTLINPKRRPLARQILIESLINGQHPRLKHRERLLMEEANETNLDTYQVTISYTSKQFQTFLMKAENADQIKDKVEMDFAEARLVDNEELDNLEFHEIRAVEINEKALPPETENEKETKH